MNLVQLLDRDLKRRVAAVEGSRLRPLRAFTSVYKLAIAALETNQRIEAVAEADLGSDTLDYEEIWRGDSNWTFLPAFDHPDEPARCLVSGTGLTHRKGAQNRDSMHAGAQTVTDSMRMYQMGVDGGRPAHGEIGTSPEWFYKGNGSILKAHNDPLQVPWFGGDGGEEPEIAGAYLIDFSGQPRHVGMCAGNEFSDHQVERINYLYLAPSKLRMCSIGPELVLRPHFESISGNVRVRRADQVLWEKSLQTGEEAMCHSLANIEHHHFKYTAHRQPGDVHIHFFGAGAFSFGEGVALQDGDVMEIEWENFGRPLRNSVSVEKRSPELVRTLPI